MFFTKLKTDYLNRIKTIGSKTIKIKIGDLKNYANIVEK